MKQFLLVHLITVFSIGVNAQSPVKWTYNAVKLEQGVFEIHLTASIEPGWHIYAQQQPEEAIAVPTAINFTKNPIVSFIGETKEWGHREHFKDATLGIEAFQYAQKIDFVQQVKLKIKGKTNLRGDITFQVCTDEKCLPPATTAFNIILEN